MATFSRHVDVDWSGSIMEGKGQVKAGTGAFTLPVTFPRRIGEPEGFVRVFNVFDQQDAVAVDEVYTLEGANPVVGGDRADLAHVKALDADGHEQATIIKRNPNYGNVTVRQNPRSVQLGVRWLF